MVPRVALLYRPVFALTALAAAFCNSNPGSEPLAAARPEASPEPEASPSRAPSPPGTASAAASPGQPRVANATASPFARRCGATQPSPGGGYVQVVVSGQRPALAAEVAQSLKRAETCAFVVDSGRSALVFLAAQSEDVSRLAGALSAQFQGFSLMLMGDQEERFSYRLFSGGALADTYDSLAREGDRETAPSGGDVEVLLRVTGSTAAPDDVETILRRGRDTYGGYAYESSRHRELMDALGLPAWTSDVGYEAFHAGGWPKAVPKGTVYPSF